MRYHNPIATKVLDRCARIGVKCYIRSTWYFHICPFLPTFYKLQGKYIEAITLYERLLAIREAHLGPDHPTVAKVLDSQAGILVKQVRP